MLLASRCRPAVDFAALPAQVLPREHGSWSLALEPLALGAIAAPSAAGAWLALAVLAAFFARRPLRAVWCETQPKPRAAAQGALAACGIVAFFGFAGAVLTAGVAWIGWLIPSAAAAAVFLRFDLRNAGRDEAAEVAGAMAFALLPVAMVALSGGSREAAVALGVAMAARAIPTVLTIRAAIRGAKTGQWHGARAIAAAFVALATVAALAQRGTLPGAAAWAVAILTTRTLALLVFPRPVWRARTLGMLEAGLGLGFVALVGTACR